jgi:predicted nucleic-acid-binding Zn-ribbon protein
MKNGVCPKCGSKEVLSNLLLRGGGNVSPYVEVTEPEPEKRSFIWTPKYEQGTFRAWVCGACGYTEFYAENYQALHEGWKKGHRSR